VLLSVFDVGDGFVVFRVDGGALVVTTSSGDAAGMSRAIGEVTAAGPKGARARREVGARLFGGHVEAIRDRRLILVLDGVLHHARLDLLSLPTARHPSLQDWIRGLAVLPSAALLAHPAPSNEQAPGARNVPCVILDRRPLAGYVGSAPPTSSLAQREAADAAALLPGPSSGPAELVDFVDGERVLPDLLGCSVMDSGVREAVDIGPGRAAEGLPLEARSGAAWVALGEIAAQAPKGVLATHVALDERARSTVDTAFDAAIERGDPPDVAVLQAVRALRRRKPSERGGVRWLAPSRDTIVERHGER
jgi:hypothetical protein